LSKQDEIKLGIDDIILKGGSLQIGTADKILKYLDSKGVKLETKAWTAHGVVSTVYESLIKE
jgi:hypothetical protein